MADKIYCYPDTGILKNRMNIHDAGRFSEAEIRFVSIRLYQLYANPISGSFDLRIYAVSIIIYFRIFTAGRGKQEP